MRFAPGRPLRRSAAPRSLVWEVTSACNLRCAHCYNVWTAPGVGEEYRDLSPEDRRRVLARLAESRSDRRLRVLTFTGGEPLLVTELEALLGEAAQDFPGVQLVVSTNGLLLTADRATALRDAGASSVQLTLLAPDAALHDKLVGRVGAFETVLTAVANAKAAGLVVAVFFVAMSSNIERWPGTAKLAAALGADAVVFNRFQPGGRNLSGWQAMTPSREALVRAHRRCQDLRKYVDVQFGTILPPCEMTVSEARRRKALCCPVGTKKAYPTIGPDGWLRPCNHWPLRLGDVLEEPVDDLLRLALPHLRPERRLPPECVDCRWVHVCKGGCPAARQLAGRPVYACGAD